MEDDFEQPIDIIKRRIEQTTKEMARFGKKPLLNSEQIRLKNNIIAVSNFNEISNLEMKIKPDMELLNTEQEFLNNRIIALNKRPNKMDDGKPKEEENKCDPETIGKTGEPEKKKGDTLNWD